MISEVQWSIYPSGQVPWGCPQIFLWIAFLVFLALTRLPIMESSFWGWRGAEQATHPKIELFSIKIILSWSFLRNCRYRRSSENSTPFVRVVYVRKEAVPGRQQSPETAFSPEDLPACQGNLCLPLFPPFWELPSYLCSSRTPPLSLAHSDNFEFHIFVGLQYISA